MRARWLKPEFFTDKKLAALGMGPALVFEALWCVADDGGVAQCDAVLLKGQMFMRWEELPVDVIQAALDRLAEAGRVHHYSIGDRDYYDVRSWEKNQPVHNPSKFRHPRPVKELTAQSGEALRQEGDIPAAGLPPSSPPIHLDSSTPQLPDTSTPETTDDVRGRVRTALPESYHDDLNSLLDIALGKASERESWLRSLHAVLFDGYEFPSRDPEILGQGLREMLGAQGAPTWRKYSGFVRRLLKGDDIPVKTNGHGKIEHAIELAAGQQLEEVQKLKIGVQTLQGTKWHIPIGQLQELPPAVQSAIAALGGSLTSGAQRILDTPGDKYGILLSQFTKLYAGAIQTERARISA
jgi:hypothetical protein